MKYQVIFVNGCLGKVTFGPKSDDLEDITSYALEQLERMRTFMSAKIIYSKSYNTVREIANPKL